MKNIVNKKIAQATLVLGLAYAGASAFASNSKEAAVTAKQDKKAAITATSAPKTVSKTHAHKHKQKTEAKNPS